MLFDVIKPRPAINKKSDSNQINQWKRRAVVLDAEGERIIGNCAVRNGKAKLRRTRLNSNLNGL